MVQPTLPVVSVVIPHYNDLTALSQCVELLARQDYPADAVEIVVADNNSRCGLAAVRSAAPGALVVPAPIQGAGPARNAGVAAARGEVIAFIDSDCAPDPGWLRRGIDALSRFDFVGGQVVTTSRDRERPTGVEAFEMVFAFDFKRYIERVGFTGTGNMFVPRATFEAVGPFRTGVSEDIEWSHRARSKGFRLGYAPDAVVRHPARHDWRNLKARWTRMLDEQYRYACERRYGRLTWAAAALGMPGSIVPHALKVLHSERLKRPSDKLRAVGILARLRIWRTGAMIRLLAGGSGAEAAPP